MQHALAVNCTSQQKALDCEHQYPNEHLACMPFCLHPAACALLSPALHHKTAFNAAELMQA